MNSDQLHVLSFEPNSSLTVPYLCFPPDYHFHSYQTLPQQTLPKLSFVPNLTTVSTSFPPEQLVDFLWQLKTTFKDQIIPLVFVIDWSQPLTQIPGTTWGGKVGVLHSLSSKEEVRATLNRLNPKVSSHYNEIVSEQ